MKNKTDKLILSDNDLKKHMKSAKFKAFMCAKHNGKQIGENLALEVIKGIRAWGIEKGCTYFSHYFISFRGEPSELKIKISKNNSKMELMEMLKAEADASSFPSGGARSTESARGYILADLSSSAFIKEDENGNRTLCIPAVFLSYSGEVLDLRLPLLRAKQSLKDAALRLLNLLGMENVNDVNLMVGAEQEYFLLNKDTCSSRKDLKFLNRTVFEYPLIISQNQKGNYFSVIDDNVWAFMSDLSQKLEKYDIVVKHQHAEVAPCQYEIVPNFTSAIICADQNQILKSEIFALSQKYGYKAVFNEKPFVSVNGSGKHLNLSIMTDTGENLLDSGTAHKQLFCVFFTAVLTAVSQQRDLLSALCFSRSNSLRLGGDEAPTACLSMSVCGEVLEMLNGNIREKDKEEINPKSAGVPFIKKNICDRNRTSPFAFCDNKFELRMVGSNNSMYMILAVFSSAVAKVLNEISSELEKSKINKEVYLKQILDKLLKNSKDIIFNGDCYSKEWKIEAERRGLSSVTDIISASKIFERQNVKELFNDYLGLCSKEVEMYKTVMKERYLDELMIESKVVIDVLSSEILPTLYSLQNNDNFSDKNKRKFSSTASALEDYSEQLNIKVLNIKSPNTNENEINLINEVTDLILQISAKVEEISPILPQNHRHFANFNNILF